MSRRVEEERQHAGIEIIPISGEGLTDAQYARNRLPIIILRLIDDNRIAINEQRDVTGLAQRAGDWVEIDGGLQGSELDSILPPAWNMGCPLAMPSSPAPATGAETS